MRWLSLCLAISAGLAGAAALARQTPPAPQVPVFKSGVDLVQLDVSVLDKKRQPVRGLTQADFTIFEDGKPQTVAAFSTVDFPDVVLPTTKWMRDVAPDVTTNEIANKRLMVILLDEDVTDERDLWAVNALKESAIKIINRLQTDDLATVMYSRNNTDAQNFTNDRSKLIKAVNAYRNIGRASTPCAMGAPETLARVTQYLDEAALPDRRKTIVFLAANIAPPGTCPDICGNDPCMRMLDVLHSAQRANINVYPVDVCGLRPPTLNLADYKKRCAPGQEGDYQEEHLRTLAENTGGKAIVNTNDFEPGINQIFVENSSYYLLGYRPQNVKADGTFRRLEVKVNRPDVEVRTRNQYTAPRAPRPEDSKAAKPAPGLLALANILPKTDLPLRIAVAPFAVPGKQEMAVAVALGVRQPARSERITEEVTLFVRAFTPEGDARGSADQPITLNIPAARRGDDVTRYDLLGRIDLKPGRYELRVSAHSATLDKRGSVYADVEVPDFAKAPLSLSGVMLSATPGVPAAPVEALRGIVPVIPTTEREFARVERVSAFMRVYQGGKDRLASVPLTIRIVDSQDKTVVEQTDTLGAERFATARAADETFALPLTRLAPGEYLLTFEATLGKATARRDVRFRVR